MDGPIREKRGLSMLEPHNGKKLRGECGYVNFLDFTTIVCLPTVLRERGAVAMVSSVL
jgi:hypothetical protein